MFDERKAVAQLLALKKEGDLEQVVGDVVLLHLDNGITIRVEKLWSEQYSILPFADRKCKKPIEYDDIGYGIMHTCSVIEEYVLRDAAWIKKHLK